MNDNLALYPAPFHFFSEVGPANRRLLLALFPLILLRLYFGHYAAAWTALAALAGAFAAFLIFVRSKEALYQLDWAAAPLLGAAVIQFETPLWSVPAGFLAAWGALRLWAPRVLRNSPLFYALMGLAPLFFLNRLTGGTEYWTADGWLELGALALGGLYWALGRSGFWPLLPLFPATHFLLESLPLIGGESLLAGLCHLGSGLFGEGWSDQARLTIFLGFFFLPTLTAGFGSRLRRRLMVFSLLTLGYEPGFHAHTLLGGLAFSAVLTWENLAGRLKPRLGPEPPDFPSGLVCRPGCRRIRSSPGQGEWLGPPSCRLALEADGGLLACPQGCLGLGDCLLACPTGALRFDPENRLHVAPDSCLGCGRCLTACPLNILTLQKPAVRADIRCRSLWGPRQASEICPEACLGCGRCRKACPAGAIQRNSAVGAMAVDRRKCEQYGPSCGEACSAACPRSIPGQGIPFKRC